MDRAQWLGERRKGIGGSDAPVIALGEYFGKTVQDLYYEKVNGADPIDSPDMRRGRRQEPVAVKVLEEMQPDLHIKPVGEILQHPEHPFMLANLDRMVHDLKIPDDYPLEIKCPRLSVFSRWKREGIPEGPLVQGAHYMAVTGAKRVLYGIFCAELDELIPVLIDRDDDLINLLIDKERKFWGHVEAKEPPPVDVDAPLELPPVGGELVKMDSPEWARAAHTLKTAKELKAEAEALEEDAKATIQGLMGDNDVVEGAGLRCYWKWQKGRKSMDKKAMARDGIDLSKYEKEGKSFRSFRPFWVQGG